MTLPTVLVVDDESALRKLMRIALEANEWKVIEAADGQHAIVEAAMARPDLILLDLTLPDTDGIDVLRRLREFSNAPIVVVSARGDDNAKIALLDAGADDYVTKPFSTGELLARMRVALRHAAPTAVDQKFVSGDLSVDLASRDVRYKGAHVNLTATEYQLLAEFIRNAGRTMTHTQLLKSVWGPGSVNEVQYLRVFVNQLRRKLEADPSAPSRFVTVPGVGYRMEV